MLLFENVVRALNAFRCGVKNVFIESMKDSKATPIYCFYIITGWGEVFFVIVSRALINCQCSFWVLDFLSRSHDRRVNLPGRLSQFYVIDGLDRVGYKLGRGCRAPGRRTGARVTGGSAGNAITLSPRNYQVTRPAPGPLDNWIGNVAMCIHCTYNFVSVFVLILIKLQWRNDNNLT